MARFAAPSAASPAAYGVLFRDPLKPAVPALPQEMALPSGSVIVTSVLLKLDWMYAFPRGTCFRSLFLTRGALFFSANRYSFCLAISYQLSAFSR
jgi:hypothetical protein